VTAHSCEFIEHSRWRIIVFCVAAGAVYGVAHDEITARLSVEYFTVAHPVIIRTESPTLLGLIWGLTATIPITAAAGWLLSTVALSRGLPPEPMAAIVRSLVRLLCFMGASAVLFAWAAWMLVKRGLI
jgi:hypothetical protein